MYARNTTIGVGRDVAEVLRSVNPRQSMDANLRYLLTLLELLPDSESARLTPREVVITR